ncbi:MAG: hypothetical protein KDI13_10140 [Alphaproteobacteria bacterium]|nr:hypothetical protein [Alphaproteobacteria bacterium]
MDTQAKDVYYVLSVPPLFYLFCAMAAMGFVVSACLWLVRAWSGLEGADFSKRIWADQLHVFLGVCGLSFFYNFFQVVEGGVLLAAAGIFAFGAYRAQERVAPALLGQVLAIAKMILLCFAGWAATFLCVYLLSFVFPIFVGALIALCGWLAVVCIFYMRWPSAQRSMKLHDVLWPVLMAYFLVLAPLQLQQFWLSKEWQDMRHAYPSLRRA